MSLRSLPKADAFARPQAYEWDAPARALTAWADKPFAAESDDPNTISIYEVIGEDFWTGGGFTSKRAAGALRAIGSKPVTVNINSPGGDMFEGLAIYNLFRDHPAKVTVRVMGTAASAASVIAMAGDDIQMGLGTTMMVHNAWGLVIGNRHDFAEASNVFDVFDKSMASIYMARTGLKEADILGMLDGPSKASDGTWMTAADAVDKGFADSIFEGVSTAADARSAVPEHIVARRQLEALMAGAGVGRKERAARINSLLSGTRDAARPAARDAGDLSAIAESLRSLQSTLSP